jgi:hypothetical protein
MIPEGREFPIPGTGEYPSLMLRPLRKETSDNRAKAMLFGLPPYLREHRTDEDGELDVAVFDALDFLSNYPSLPPREGIGFWVPAQEVFGEAMQVLLVCQKRVPSVSGLQDFYLVVRRTE